MAEKLTCFLCGCHVDENDPDTWFYPGDRVACGKCGNLDAEGHDRNLDDDRETIAPGDERYYRTPGAADR